MYNKKKWLEKETALPAGCCIDIFKWSDVIMLTNEVAFGS